MNDSPFWPQLVSIAHTWIHFLWVALFPHLLTLGGFILALLITGRFFNEKRNPSNIFAWSLLIIFMPYLGVPLYFLFGGRKSRKLAKSKKNIRAIAEEVSLAESEWKDQADPSIWNPKQGIYHGNDFILLGDGVSTYEALCYEIEQAKNSIHIMTYILSNDEVGAAMVEKLILKAKEGIEVRLLVDALGGLGRVGPLMRKLRKNGAHAVRFMPMLPLQTKTSANLRNHRKMAIFDGKRAIVGGQNIDKRFMGPTADPACFHDFSALISGPVVAHFNMIFVSDWCFASKSKPTQFKSLLQQRIEPKGKHTLKVMSSGPDVPGDPLWEALITLIQECQHELTIVTPYFIPDEVLFRSLIVKAHTGRRVRIILPEKSNHRMVDFARNYYLRQLDRAGVEVLFFHTGMIHAKLFVVDNKVAMMGSANIDMRSLFVNFEVGVFLTSEASIEELQNWLHNIYPQCHPYHASETAQVSDNRRILEDFAHLLGPLL
ncbi:MAG: phospholipase D-like domain-containing protein [Opitutales bacterium]